ncbi:MAG: hypothetical protein COW30_16025 [Rhodospirillales bacterium CG15_BIG_FIL_POST_REV_8_21_14_020_66_15]|nr:MAG: hypothetical protein COW30_16025 [Rhodospirillales bacterium CG15_BIG_FIL_POST_REV_8_21_14_020_66_15]
MSSIPLSSAIGAISLLFAVGADASESNLTGEYRGLYAYCGNSYPCSEADFAKAKDRSTGNRNDFGLKLWQENGTWKAMFFPPAKWKNFRDPKEARFVEVTKDRVHFRVDRPIDFKTLEMDAAIGDGRLDGKILYNGYTMHGRLTRK